MKILMLTPYLPFPPSSGGQIRSYNLIKQLSKRHKITLCSLIKNDEDKKYIDKLKPFCDNVYVFKRSEKPWTLSNIIKTGFSLFPFLVIRNFSPSEQNALPKIIESGGFDIIHAETFYVGPHIPETKIPMVLVDQTIEFQVYEHYVKNYEIPLLKPLLYLDVLKIRYWESYYWKKAKRVIAVSERDAQIMRQVVKGLEVTVVPNGVGEDLMDDVPLHFSENILFVGNFAWLQNTEAAEILANKVFPKIVEKIPGARLNLVGQNTDKITRLKSDKVNLVDLAVDDIMGVKRAFRNNGVLVTPLYGPGGTRLKILGAMAAKLPVVTTKTGIAGLEAENNVSVLQGETPEELADLTIKILEDKGLYKAVASNARKLVEERYSYETIAKKLNQVYEEARNG